MLLIDVSFKLLHPLLPHILQGSEVMTIVHVSEPNLLFPHKRGGPSRTPTLTMRRFGCNRPEHLLCLVLLLHVLDPLYLLNHLLELGIVLEVTISNLIVFGFVLIFLIRIWSIGNSSKLAKALHKRVWCISYGGILVQNLSFAR